MLFIIKTLIDWRRFILAAGVATALLAALVSLFLPKWYTATSSVFPPEPKSLSGSYSDILQSLQLPIMGPAAIGARPSTIYVDILRSRRVREKIVDEFDLMSAYRTRLVSDAMAELGSHTSITLEDNGLLIIAFEDRDPERAAAIANRQVALLDDYNRQANVTRASKTKEFIAGQLDLHMSELRDAEEELKRFQEEHQALELDGQVKAAIDIVTTLTADAIKLEVELEILKQYTSGTSQEYLRKKKEYDEMLGQLRKFKVSSTRADDDLVRSFFPTFDTIPEVSLEMARLTRRVAVEEKVYELLIKEYEQSRIEEARDTPTIQVLDAAKAPELRSRPKRKVLTIVGGVVGIGWSALIAIFVSLWRDDRARGERVRDVFGPLAGDIRRVFRRGA